MAKFIPDLLMSWATYQNPGFITEIKHQQETVCRTLGEGFKVGRENDDSISFWDSELGVTVLYAKGQMQNPTAKAEYEALLSEDNRNPYAVAVADFLNAPDINKIDLSNYTGNKGDTIRIQVTDDFMVMSVSVRIENPDGSLVETGNAIQQPNVIDWLCTATAKNTTVAGDKIIVRATDKSGNMHTQEQTI